MVKGIFTCDEELGILEMRVQGHANFDELGKDPVCAGASTIAMAAAQCISFMEQGDRLQEDAVIHIAGGNVRVQCKPRPEYFEEAMIILNVASVGMQLLAAAYPGYVRVEPFGPAEAVSK